MTDEQQIVEWRKRYRQSVAALPLALIFLGVLTLVILGVSYFIALPTWLVITTLGVAMLAVVGDVINIIFLRHKLARAQHNRSIDHESQ